MKLQNRSKLLPILMCVTMIPCVAVAATNTGRPPGKPPQEAFDACKGKSEGTSVEVTTPRGTLKATCKSMQGQMVAVPANGAPPPQNSNSNGQ